MTSIDDILSANSLYDTTGPFSTPIAMDYEGMAFKTWDPPWRGWRNVDSDGTTWVDMTIPVSVSETEDDDGKGVPHSDTSEPEPPGYEHDPDYDDNRRTSHTSTSRSHHLSPGNNPYGSRGCESCQACRRRKGRVLPPPPPLTLSLPEFRECVLIAVYLV